MKEYTNLLFPDWMLPGEWKTLEVIERVDYQTVSYALATKIHPQAKEQIDFWGNVDPYGPGKTLLFVSINEFLNERVSKERFSLTTGKHTYSGTTTKKFNKLENVIKAAVNEMVKTTKMYDRILDQKTQMWDIESIEKHKSEINKLTQSLQREL